MTAETPLEDRTELDFLCAAGIHVAAKEEHTCDTLGDFHTEDQGDAGTVAPADKGGPVQEQYIHHCPNVGGHQLIKKRASVTCAATMTPAIDKHCPIARADQCRHLIAPVATVPESA